jgi:hypothetical protein
MARCFCIRRISLGEMYQRFRRASLRIRSCMTDFLKRLSRLSCDSPSRKVTVANTPTSFLLPDLSRNKKPACAFVYWIAAGFVRLLAVGLSPYA